MILDLNSKEGQELWKVGWKQFENEMQDSIQNILMVDVRCASERRTLQEWEARFGPKRGGQAPKLVFEKPRGNAGAAATTVHA